MSDIKFECSHCQQHLACEEQDAGKQILCPACNQLIQIPQAAEATVPPAGPSRLRISHQSPAAPAQTAPVEPESDQPESDRPASGRPLPWRWIWRLVAYAVVAAALVIAWPKLTQLRELPQEASNVTKLSVQALTVQFALFDSAGAKPDGTSEAAAKFGAAMKENFGHGNFTTFSEAQKLNEWLEQWPIGGAFKLAYNRDNAQVTIWSRVEGRTTVVKNYFDAQADKLPDLMKQAKEGMQVLSKIIQ